MQSDAASRHCGRQPLRRIGTVHRSGQLSGSHVSHQPSCTERSDVHCSPRRLGGRKSSRHSLCRSTREAVHLSIIGRSQARAYRPKGESHAPWRCWDVRGRRRRRIHSDSLGLCAHRPRTRNVGSHSTRIVMTATTRGVQHTATTTCGVTQGNPVNISVPSHLRLR